MAHLEEIDIPLRVQSLLTRRSSGEYSLPPLTELHTILSSTLQDARQKAAQTAWLVLTTCTFATLNHQQAIGYVYRLVTRTNLGNASTRCDVAGATDIAAEMREAILKGVLFIGAPRTIMSMASLHATLEDDVKESLRKHPLRMLTPENVTEVLRRGNALGDSIYGAPINVMRRNVGSCHPDLVEFIEQAYGMVLAPLPGGMDVQGNLNRSFVSLVAVACLRTEGGVEQLLRGHVLGLLRTRDIVGRGSQEYWLAGEEGVEWVLATTDALAKAARAKLENSTEGTAL
ncbi:hypothetical protein C2E23DRAFT_943099 [Lenzites betulinus]|nr:hypothetical protein C2E23DRAFT_943099 [Lenzites betulinus]